MTSTPMSIKFSGSAVPVASMLETTVSRVTFGHAEVRRWRRIQVGDVYTAPPATTARNAEKDE